MIHRFHIFLRFGCCVVLILALSLSLGIHAVLLGISFCPSALGSFYRLFCFTHVISSSCETDKAADFSGSYFCASSDLSSADITFTLRLHLVLGRARLKLLFDKSIVFFVYMYAHLDLNSITDEDANRNV